MQYKRVFLAIASVAIIVFGTIFSNASASDAPQTAPQDFNPKPVVESSLGSDILIVQDLLTWGMDISGNVGACQQLNITYDLITSTTFSSMSLSDLSLYKVIILAADQDANYYNTILGNKGKLEDYVSGGGVLVVGMYRGWISYLATQQFLPGGVILNFEYSEDVDFLLSHYLVANPDRPVSNPNTTIDNISASSSYYFTNLPLEAIQVTQDLHGHTVIAEYPYGGGTVLAVGIPMEWFYRHVLGLGGIGVNENNLRLLYNEIEYALMISTPPCVEKSFTESTLFETLLGQTAVLNDVIVSGDFTSTLDFTNFEIVSITTGPFAGKGFSKGQCETMLGGLLYRGDWGGALFLKPQERKIYLKGAISGEISATVEGYLTESVSGSGTYDQYQATWRIGRLGSTTTSATINLNGTLSYQSSSEFPATELYVLQTNIEGTISGHYSGPLSTVITHIRVINGTPYDGEGFSIISYVSESGSGEGWTYDKLVSPGRVRLKGLFSNPLFGIVSATLDESKLPRTLFVTIQRVDLGLPPMVDLKVTTWGPGRVSPGQTVNYLIEYRNDGLKAADYITVGIEIPDFLEYVSSSEGGIYLPSESPAEELWFEDAVKPKTKDYKTLTVRIPWGLPQGTNFGLSAFTGSTVPEIRDGFCMRKTDIFPGVPSPDIGDCAPEGVWTRSFPETRKWEKQYPLLPLINNNGDGTCTVTFRCRKWWTPQPENRTCDMVSISSPTCQSLLEWGYKSCSAWIGEQKGRVEEKTVVLDCDIACSLNPAACPDYEKNTWNSQVATAHDPNIKYGPEGYVQAGQTLNYEVEFENEGEGIAFGVYITDVLDEDLDDLTLSLGGNGTYNPSTRTITWFVGEVGPGQGGKFNFSVNIRGDAPEGTEIINFATVYFPSVPEITKTNGVVSIIPMVGVEVSIFPNAVTVEPGNSAYYAVSVWNEGGTPDDYFLKLCGLPPDFTYNLPETLYGVDGNDTVEVPLIIIPPHDLAIWDNGPYPFTVACTSVAYPEASNDTTEAVVVVQANAKSRVRYTDLLLDALIAQVEGANIPAGVKNSLLSKLDNAKKKKEQGIARLEAGDTTVARNMFNAAANIMGAFINEVQAQRGKKIAVADADSFIAQAQNIIWRLRTGIWEGGSPPPPKMAGEDTQYPQGFELSQNYPNPFNPTTQISYTLPRDGHVKLEIYNLLGQKVATLVDEYQQAGQKTVNWEAKDLSSGIYFYKLTAGDFTATKRMVLTK